MKVFISHSPKDAKFAKELSTCLSHTGLDVWLAEQEVLPGDNWPLEVGKALQRSDAFVVLLSPDAVESENVRREMSYVLASPKFEGKVVPVMVKPARGVPWFLESLQIVHSRGKDKKALKRTVEEIVDLLEHKLAA